MFYQQYLWHNSITIRSIKKWTESKYAKKVETNWFLQVIELSLKVQRDRKYSLSFLLFTKLKKVITGKHNQTKCQDCLLQVHFLDLLIASKYSKPKMNSIHRIAEFGTRMFNIIFMVHFKAKFLNSSWITNYITKKA